MRAAIKQTTSNATWKHKHSQEAEMVSKMGRGRGERGRDGQG